MPSVQLQSTILERARSFMLRHCKARTSIVRTASGLERRSFAEHCTEVGDLLTRAGYSPRVVAAALLSHHPQAHEQQRELWVESQFDADVANLVFWILDQNSHLPRDIRESMFLSKLRSAPHAAVAIICASVISNIGSIERLTQDEIEQDVLEYCGWVPMSGDFAGRVGHLRKLAELFAEKLPEFVLRPFLAKLERVTTFESWLNESASSNRRGVPPDPAVSSGLAPPLAANEN